MRGSVGETWLVRGVWGDNMTGEGECGGGEGSVGRHDW